MGPYHEGESRSLHCDTFGGKDDLLYVVSRQCYNITAGTIDTIQWNAFIAVAVKVQCGITFISSNLCLGWQIHFTQSTFGKSLWILRKYVKSKHKTHC